MVLSSAALQPRRTCATCPLLVLGSLALQRHRAHAGAAGAKQAARAALAAERPALALEGGRTLRHARHWRRRGGPAARPWRADAALGPAAAPGRCAPRHSTRAHAHRLVCQGRLVLGEAQLDARALRAIRQLRPGRGPGALQPGQLRKGDALVLERRARIGQLGRLQAVAGRRLRDGGGGGGAGWVHVEASCVEASWLAASARWLPASPHLLQPEAQSCEEGCGAAFCTRRGQGGGRRAAVR